MIHSLWAAGDVWESAEYAAGYRARMSEIPDQENANKTWRCGWEDADTEILEVERHRRAIAEGREDDYPETWALLLDLGGDARVNGLPFDAGRSEPWREGWILADINLGVYAGITGQP